MATDEEPELVEDAPGVWVDPGDSEVPDAQSDDADGCCPDDQSSCGEKRKRAMADGAGAEAAGGTPTNAGEDGEVGDIEFT